MKNACMQTVRMVQTAIFAYLFLVIANLSYVAIPLPTRLAPGHLLRYGMIATGNHGYSDSLRDAPPSGEGIAAAPLVHINDPLWIKNLLPFYVPNLPSSRLTFGKNVGRIKLTIT